MYKTTKFGDKLMYIPNINKISHLVFDTPEICQLVEAMWQLYGKNDCDTEFTNMITFVLRMLKVNSDWTN